MDSKLKLILIIGAIILFLLIIVLSSRSRIKRIYSKYMRVGTSTNLTGGQFASISTNKLDLNINLAVTDGLLVDAYYPKRRTLIMSREVCDTASLASITIVAHELGHALQHRANYFIFSLSTVISLINRLLNRFIFPTLIVGLILIFFKYTIAINFLWISLALFIFHIFSKLLTIPVEVNASKRALWYLREYKFLSKSELRQAKRLLSTASQTYIASLFDGIIIFGDKLNKLFSK